MCVELVKQNNTLEMKFEIEFVENLQGHFSAHHKGQSLRMRSNHAAKHLVHDTNCRILLRDSDESRRHLRRTDNFVPNRNFQKCKLWFSTAPMISLVPTPFTLPAKLVSTALYILHRPAQASDMTVISEPVSTTAGTLNP